MGESFVVNGAMMTCTFGLAPSSLIVLPVRTKQIGNMPRANIMDFAPMVNIMPFGMCNTLSNPVVAAATAAKLGVFTPAACIPAVTAPWMPGSPQSMVQGQPALTNMSQCICMWGGVIRFTNDGQMPGIPPIVIPQVKLFFMMPNPGQPLSREELEKMPDEEQEAYQEDMKKAQHAGDNDLQTAERLDAMAKKYREEHTLEGIEKALKAEKLSRDYKLRAAQKQANAMNNVNEKYRGNDAPADQQNMSKEELQGVYDQKWKEHNAKQKEINKLDKKLDKKSKKLEESDANLKKANTDLQEAHKPWSEAKQDRDNATKKREAFERETVDWKIKEANATTDSSREYYHQQAATSDALAKTYGRQEKEAQARMDKAEPKYKAAQTAQREAANNYRNDLESWSKTNDKKKAAEAELNDIDKTKYAALSAMNAQTDMEKHDAAVSQYNDAKANTQQKRLEMDGYSQEQKKAQAEADAWEKSGIDSYIYDGNKDGRGDKYFANSDEYKAQAKEAGQKKEEARQEWEQSKEDLHTAYEDAFGDDAFLRQSAAELKYDEAMQNLNGSK